MLDMMRSSPGASYISLNVRKVIIEKRLLASIQRAKHLAAAAKGGGARFSDANSNSKIAKGDVTKRRR
jgi:hypothetical protein